MSALPNGISSGDLEAPDEVNALLSAVKRTLAKDYDEKLQKLEDENKELKQALDGAGNAGGRLEFRNYLEDVAYKIKNDTTTDNFQVAVARVYDTFLKIIHDVNPSTRRNTRSAGGFGNALAHVG